MGTSRGGIKNPRRNAKNYIKEQAQARLTEIMPSVQQQGLNALAVDAHNILYYNRVRGGYTCTCCATEIAPLENDGTDPIEIQTTSLPFGKSEEDEEISVLYRKPLFGERGEFHTQEDEDESADDYLINDDPELSGTAGTEDSVFSGNADCGLCYRTGYIPAYQLLGQTRYFLTTHNVVAIDGYTINRDEAPHVFEDLGVGGSVAFTFTVPKFFKSVKFCLRNNHDEIYQPLYVGSQPLTLALLKSNAGKDITVSVKGEDFTHAIIEFEHDVEAVTANVSQISRNQDYSSFDTVGTVNIFLPMTIGRVESGDLIFVPTKKMVCKVIDVTYAQTADNVRFEWQANCRVLQPQEKLKNISLSRKIF